MWQHVMRRRLEMEPVGIDSSECVALRAVHGAMCTAEGVQLVDAHSRVCSVHCRGCNFPVSKMGDFVCERIVES